MVFNMLYPKLSNVKKNNIIFIASIAISVIIINILLIINVLVDKTNHWSMLCIAGIIYAYGTVIYTKKRNVNIASNVFAQCLLVSLLCKLHALYRFPAGSHVPEVILLSNQCSIVND